MAYVALFYFQESLKLSKVVGKLKNLNKIVPDNHEHLKH